jgi:molecular chaperone GrpE
VTEDVTTSDPESAAHQPAPSSQRTPSEIPASGGDAAEAASDDPLVQAQAEAAQLKDRLIRMAADFDNFRKRSRREVTEAERKGRDTILMDLLPVFDNLERATAHADAPGSHSDATRMKALVDGITLVSRQFQDSLSRLGIERVGALGQPFDPSLHEAIQHMETSEFLPGHIAAEVQAGYKQGERLLRPAMVVVAKARPEPAGESAVELAAPDDEPTWGSTAAISPDNSVEGN